jgi:thiaminase/transcriptional activator TenA
MEYSGDAYQAVAKQARETLDRLARRSMTEERFADLAEIFGQASQLEADFWGQGLGAFG